MYPIAGRTLLTGHDFGDCGEGYLRLSWATSEARFSQAMDRMAASLARLQSRADTGQPTNFSEIGG